MGPCCDHCQDPIPAGALVREDHDGGVRRFCCRGCQAAYHLITDAGLDAFYQRRAWRRTGVADPRFASTYDDAALAEAVTELEDGSCRLQFAVEGIRCATCIWLLEKMLAREPGVSRVRGNYGNHRFSVVLRPGQGRPGGIFTLVSRLGYRPRPLTADGLRELQHRQQRTLLLRFATAAFFALQLMLYSVALYAGYFQGMSDAHRWLMRLLSALVATPAVFYGGWPFFRGAWRALRNRMPDMDLLVALGVGTAYGYSLVALAGGRQIYFDSAAMIVTLLLLGRLFEQSSRNRAMAAVDSLLYLAPEQAIRLRDGREETVASARLRPGDRILVRPGDRVPVDGEIVRGGAEFDESVVSGESMPVIRRRGEAVAAGCVNLNAAVEIRATAAAADSFLARMARLVAEVQERQAPIQRLADRTAAWFVPLVLMVAVFSGAGQLFFGAGVELALLRSVAVLVVACPCALGLATPMAVMVATGAAAGRGILFRGADVMEKVAGLRTVAFDKTGTLTQGRPQVVAIEAARGAAEELLAGAASVERGAAHPLAEALHAAAMERGLSLVPLQGVVSPGAGVRAAGWLVGSRSFLTKHGIAVPVSAAAAAMTQVHVARDGDYLGVISCDDQLRAEAREVVSALRNAGLRVVMLSGDQPEVAARIGAALGMDEVHGGMQPEAKAAWVAREPATMMVGDGINDAPALAAATVGCAMSGGTDIALESSQLVFTRPDLRRLVTAIGLARKTMAVIRQNLFWAFSYNLVAIPLAISGYLAPVWAAAAMAASSVLVVANSQRLRWALGRNLVKAASK